MEYSGIIGLLIASINDERQSRESIQKEITGLKEQLKILNEVINQLLTR